MAAICKQCGQEMVQGGDCPANREVELSDGTKMPSVPYQPKTNTNCHDCGVAPGNYHHPSCDMERCPKCGEQLISCPCEMKRLINKI